MNDIIMKVSELTGISQVDILSRKRTQDICEARRIFIYIMMIRLSESRAAVAKYLRMTDQNVSYNLIVFNNQLNLYKGLKNKIARIENDIIPIT
ncbi:helix-turn-helix domain-containing protein [Dysgonomonas sp. BGC7]|uniref:helix-turn-helix domain-containing protein n=1 Tax=Dysgonomonas sp. BGC7 TaxID=1658008 RepID=UPI000A5CE6C5|nr:helix-turn-helix domain-containing protein [Dysgonomonas sp. BGC7]MBD8389654.1 hypothetical protein [Dysgonomonas sp. BGC7]